MEILIFVAAVAVLEISCKGEAVSEFIKEPDKVCLAKEDCQQKTLPQGHLRKLGQHTGNYYGSNINAGLYDQWQRFL